MRIASAEILRNAFSACSGAETLEDFLAELSADERRFLAGDWVTWARADQMPPDVGEGAADWTTWLMLGGRGSGKTRAGAEWVRRIAATDPRARIALVAETLGDARSVMVEGVSGLLGVHPPHARQVTWPNGAIAQLFSADDPESLRGPQFTAAWGDELCKWRHAEAAWDMLQFGLRLGLRPRQVVTTTPRPLPMLKRLMAEPGTIVTRAGTSANAANLAPAFLDAVVARYRGTRLGRQELDAEILEDRLDALWPRGLIEQCRARVRPPLTRIVVAVDPPASSGAGADACGIVVAGRGEDGRAYVLSDASVERARPLVWARAALAAFHRFEADCLVAEVNQGGELVEAVIRQIDPAVPLRTVRATRGKWVRAEPVAALYEQGRVAHVGALPELEDEMCDFGADGLSAGRSPDRVDALVWALTELMLRGREPRIRTM